MVERSPFWTGNEWIVIIFKDANHFLDDSYHVYEQLAAEALQDPIKCKSLKKNITSQY